MLCRSWFLRSVFPVLLVLYLVAPSQAQTSKIFQWQFTDSVSTTLPSCKSLSILVKPFDPNNDTHGVPPFYMMAFEIGGTPRTTLIGLNESSISWTVDHAVGAKLMLDVVDSTGSAGGIPPQLYTVGNGQSTACVKDTSISGFTVTANVTDTVQTCQPWGLRIQGGVRPYNLTLAAVNSPIVTNVTLGPDDDAYTYIDRADPNTQLMAAISDFNGNWATGTPIVNTKGDTNVDCIGLVSTGGNTTQLQQQADAAAAAQKKSEQNKKVAIGVTVPLVLLALAGAAFAFWYYRKRKAQQELESGIGKKPEPFLNSTEMSSAADGQVLSINSFISPISSQDSPKESPLTPGNYTMTSFTSPDSALPRERTSSGSSGRPGFAAFPTAPGRRSAKAIEAGYGRDLTHTSSESSSSIGPAQLNRAQSATPVSANTTPSPASALPLRSLSLNAVDEQSATSAAAEYVYQHRDGGAVVRELPPPYADRSLNNGDNQEP